MAFIASYISTVAGGSELATFVDEAAELGTTLHEAIIKESFDWVNEYLDTFIQTPLPLQPTTGRYPAIVREAQIAKAAHLVLRFVLGVDNERTITARLQADDTIARLIEGKANIEAQYSQDEIGFNYPVAGSSNTSTALLQVDRNAAYTGDTERTYTITSTSSADIGTATYSWTNGEGTSGTGTSDYDWDAIEEGLSIRWMASPSGGVAIVTANTWKIRCVPQETKVDAPGSLVLSIPARN